MLRNHGKSINEYINNNKSNRANSFRSYITSSQIWNKYLKKQKIQKKIDKSVFLEKSGKTSASTND
jgi:hypothetical protein